MEGFDPALELRFKRLCTLRQPSSRRRRGCGELSTERARGRRCLEFAIGTGRIPLPLTSHGIEVDGVELSPHMVERLRTNRGGERIEVTLGDMSIATTGRRYGLVYLVYNTIFNLLTVNAQIRCFENPHAISPTTETSLWRPQRRTPR